MSRRPLNATHCNAAELCTVHRAPHICSGAGAHDGHARTHAHRHARTHALPANIPMSDRGQLLSDRHFQIDHPSGSRIAQCVSATCSLRLSAAAATVRASGRRSASLSSTLVSLHLDQLQKRLRQRTMRSMSLMAWHCADFICLKSEGLHAHRCMRSVSMAHTCRIHGPCMPWPWHICQDGASTIAGGLLTGAGDRLDSCRPRPRLVDMPWAQNLGRHPTTTVTASNRPTGNCHPQRPILASIIDRQQLVPSRMPQARQRHHT